MILSRTLRRRFALLALALALLVGGLHSHVKQAPIIPSQQHTGSASAHMLAVGGDVSPSCGGGVGTHC